jgi:hypothetical protein
MRPASGRAQGAPSRGFTLSRPWLRSLLHALLVVGSGSALAWTDLVESGHPGPADGIHVTDGSYVMDVGELQVNITNHGLIGSQYSMVSTYADAPSAQWPAGSGNEYLWAAGLWIGALVNGQPLVSTGQYERELRPGDDLRDTIYETREGVIVRPGAEARVTGARAPDPLRDDDGDGREDEDLPDGYDNDGDGLVDEDFGQLGRQMMVCTMYDNTRLAQEEYPDHEPLGIKVVQSSFAWNSEENDDFVVFDYEIENVGRWILENVYVGLFADCDIGPRDAEETGQNDMAGYYEGETRASDGTFMPVSFGYMYDADPSGALPGYFGVMFVGDKKSSRIQIRSFQRFSGQTPYEMGGDPTNDPERYEILGLDEHDPDVPEGMRNDYRFLVSTGPWRSLSPGRKLRFSLAFVMGESLEDLIRNGAEIMRIYEGAYFDLDNDPTTGIRGRETELCFPEIPDPETGIYRYDADFFQMLCVPENYPMNLIKPEDFEQDPETGWWCIWVNSDNCEECDRRSGHRCRQDGPWFYYFMNFWDCNQTQLSPERRVGCTGVGGRESPVTWIADAPPPTPGLRVWPANHAVHVYWDNASEVEPMYARDVYGFESYRIWRADNWARPPGSTLETGPASNLWRLLAEYDVVNHYILNRTDFEPFEVDTLPLGDNTGFADIVYRPRCLDDPRFTGLAEAMQEVVDGDVEGAWRVRPPLRDSTGQVVPGLEVLLPWEGHPTVLDTFFAVAERPADPEAGVVGKTATRYYEYVDWLAANGRIYFYAVSSTAHHLTRRAEGYIPISGGLDENLRGNFDVAVPGSRAQTAAERRRDGADIYVYPNPATRRSLAAFQPLKPNADDPTGLRVMFANLPRARNTLKIFTLDGDHVATIEHDGTGGHGEVSWNLVSLNGQQVVSGIYLYTVHSDDARFEDFIGKFVLIR